MIIKTETVDTFVWILNHLKLYAADIEVDGTYYADSDFTNVIIATVGMESISVWNRDHKGGTLQNSHRIIPIESIISITIL